LRFVVPSARQSGKDGARVSIRVDREDGVAVVAIDRQEALNALDVETLTELRDRLRELAEDESVHVVVLTGAGDRAFVAGADIKYMAGLGREEARKWGGLGHEAALLLEVMPKPTIAAINGFALGGGCELALACDLRYASSKARLGQPEIELGIVPGWGGTQRLARVCGLGAAKELILTGRLIDAEEALRIGLVNAIADPVLDHALDVAEQLAAKSPVALRVAKRLLNLSPGALTQEAEEFGDLFATEDAKEGLAAFAEKRAPRFVGR
jgi:enoyl-CoA hydratase